MDEGVMQSRSEGLGDRSIALYRTATPPVTTECFHPRNGGARRRAVRRPLKVGPAGNGATPVDYDDHSSELPIVFGVHGGLETTGTGDSGG